ncbi:3-keto-disaccharide hydrolase [Crateriforma spongiae]|uniref:3-keto-disaccharide hydrolase n=1 Tax=Crateriforma spongiae TaxID=2724528 RepID=UPI0014481AFF|nr:DUF1080 domain-containing protein [Crateriforma spongiae]
MLVAVISLQTFAPVQIAEPKVNAVPLVRSTSRRLLSLAFTALLTILVNTETPGQDGRSLPTTPEKASVQTIKPEIVSYPDARVWSNRVIAESEYPGLPMIGEFRRDNRAMQVTVAGEKFYLSVFNGGLPGDGWDGSPIQHRWVGTQDIAEQLHGWNKADRSQEVVGKEPPQGSVVLFDGSDTKEWVNGKVEDGFLKAGTRTKEKFQDFRLYFEFLIPLKPEPPVSHPHRGNSGVFAVGAYEIQIADTFGLDFDKSAWSEMQMLKPVNTWCGSIYGIRAPNVNMCLPPLTWQSMEIEFKAARFKDSRKISPAVISVIQNGVKIHDQIELPEGTGGGPGGPRQEVPSGPIVLQNHGNPNLFRNIWIVAHGSRVR